MESGDHAHWEWQSGDRGFHFNIPPRDRCPLPLPPGSEGENIHFQSEIGVHWVPDLSGRTLEEVEREASRIRLGEQFTSITEFDRCVHSWCVLNGRISTRIKTQWNFAIQVCHFGGRVRPLWRHQQHGPPVEPIGDSGEEHSLILDEAGLLTGQSARVQIPGGQQPPQFPGGQQPPQIPRGQQLPHHNREESRRPGLPSPCRPFLRQACSLQVSGPQACTESSSSTPLTFSYENDCENSCPNTATVIQSLPFQSAPPLPTVLSRLNGGGPMTRNTTFGSITRGREDRPPLQEVDITSQVFDGHNITTQTSVIRNTRQWIPVISQPGTGSRTINNHSVSGACGQLGRMVPSNSDGPHTLCPWRVRVHLDRTGKFAITVCRLRHTCPANAHKWRGPTHQAFWLGQTLAPRVVRNVKVAVKELTNGFQMDYRKTTNYHQMWRARDLVKDWYLGGQRKSFHMIPSLLARVKDVDPESVTDWSTHDGTRIFRRAFICPSATRGFLKFCQPLLSLDACHTKNRKYPCQLFLATVLDGSMRGTILCYAIAPVESTDNWRWFLELLLMAIHDIEDPELPLISDRQKGLIAAVHAIFPHHFHGHCAHHLRGNVKKAYGKAAETLFWGAVYAHTPAQ